MCQTLELAARLNDLPVAFLTRLIWQESRFDAHAVSPAGARGVAQFMPETAAGRGLANPFDVTDAINKSAEFLRDLTKQFGNLGDGRSGKHCFNCALEVAAQEPA